MLKKKCIVIALLCLTLCFSFFAACQFSFPYEPSDSVDSSYNGGTSSDIGGGDAVEPESSIKISNKPSVLNLGDEWQLTVTVKDIAETVEWSSDNPDVVAVTSSGKLTAKAVGRATITASAGDYSDSVSVSVDDKVQPVLSANESGDVNVFVGGSYRANPTLSFNGSIVNDVVFSYSVDDDTVADVATDGTVTTKKAGTCVITITAEYRSHVLTATYKVVSCDGKSISLDKNTVSLYTYAISGEKTSEQLTAKLTENGEETGSEGITWTSSDENVATVDGGLITAVSAGSAKITAKYDSDGSSVEAVANVTVVKTTAVIGTSFNIELDKDFVLPSSDIADFAVANVISVKSGTVECLTTLEGGTKKLDKDLLVGSPDAKTLTVETNKVSYTVTATVYNAIIKTVADLDALQDKLSRHDRQGDAAANGYYYDGYVIFDADIDYEGNTFGGICVAKYLKPTGSSISTPATTNGFAGIIDGNNHVISNISVGDGFIGNLVKQDQAGTIKNLTFDGITVKNKAGGGIAQSVAAGVIENVTVKGKVYDYDTLLQYQAMGIVSAVINSASAKFKNVTVFYDGVMKQPGGVAEANLCMVTVFGRMGGNYTANALFENCQVIGADANGNILPLFGYGFTTGEVTGYTPYTEKDGVIAYATMDKYLVATGWTKKDADCKEATCTEAGCDVYEKDGEDDYKIVYPALGHDWSEEGGNKCSKCGNVKEFLTKETDVKTGFDFAKLDDDKTISSIIYDGAVLDGTSVTFKNEDASMTARVYDVNYTDGSTTTVKLTVWSLLMESEADMRLMKDYVVKIPVAYQNGTEQATSSYYQYVGYFKLNADITWSNNNWTQADGIVDNSTGTFNVFATEGFYGVIDGGNHTITGFRTQGNHTGLVNVLGTGGVIKNLTFNNVTICSGVYYHGIIAGYAHGGTIENVTINGVVRESGAPNTVLVGTFCTPNAGEYYAKYHNIITGVSIKDVEINAVNGEFGAAFGEGVAALGGIEAHKYNADNDLTGLALPECKNVVITGASTIIRQRLDENDATIVTNHSTWTGVALCETEGEYLLATGWSLKSHKDATCTEDGYDLYEKDGKTYRVEYKAPGHKWNDDGTCDVCGQEKSISVEKETDVKTGFDFASLDESKTISSVTYNGAALEFEEGTTTVKFKNDDASLTATRSYEVNYTDGSTTTVKLTVWSLLMESEADMRLMKDYVVKIPVNYQTGATVNESDKYQYVGYFKLNADITWSSTAWTQADGIVDELLNDSGNIIWAKLFATEGFYGVIDGGNHTITGFRTTGNHTGLVNVLGTGGVIKNLTFNNVTIYGGTYSHGIIAGYAHGGTIENVTINGVDRSGSNAPSTVLVGTLCQPNAGQYYKSASFNLPAVITGVNIKNVTINAVNGDFGAEFGEDVSVLGEAETNMYTGTWEELPLPKCENVVITGASTIIRQKISPTNIIKYSEWVGVNGKTEETAE